MLWQGEGGYKTLQAMISGQRHEMDVCQVGSGSANEDLKEGLEWAALVVEAERRWTKPPSTGTHFSAISRPHFSILPSERLMSLFVAVCRRWAIDENAFARPGRFAEAVGKAVERVAGTGTVDHCCKIERAGGKVWL